MAKHSTMPYLLIISTAINIALVIIAGRLYIKFKHYQGRYEQAQRTSWIDEMPTNGRQTLTGTEYDYDYNPDNYK